MRRSETLREKFFRFTERVNNVRSKAGIHRDTAAEDSIRDAASDGLWLAKRIREELASTSERTGIDYTRAGSLSLSEIDDEGRDETPGSYLNTVCAGAIMTLNIDSLYGNVNDSQDRVMHFMLTKALAAWEVGEEKSGHAPFPFLPDGTHISYSPDTLKGGQFSLAHSMMQRCRSVRSGGRRKKKAYIVAEALMEDLDLTPASFEAGRRWTPKLADAHLPKSSIEAIARSVMLIPSFWPSYLNGRRLTW